MFVNEIKWDIIKSPDKKEFPVVEILASENTRRAFKGGAEWYPYFEGDEKDFCSMIAVYLGNRLDVMVTDGESLEACAWAIRHGKDCRQAVSEEGYTIIEDAGFTFEDSSDYHFKDEKFNRLQDLAVMSMGMLLQMGLEGKDSYMAKRFQLDHSQNYLDEIDIKRTWLEGDARPFEFEDEYWLDQLDVPVSYLYSIAWTFDEDLRTDIGGYIFSDLNTALAYADKKWELLTEEFKAPLCSFRLTVIEQTDDCEGGMSLGSTVKEYIRR